MTDEFDKCIICGSKMVVDKSHCFDNGDVIYEFVCDNCQIRELKLKRNGSVVE